jgi:hypothetical protein
VFMAAGNQPPRPPTPRRLTWSRSRLLSLSAPNLQPLGL